MHRFEQVISVIMDHSEQLIQSFMHNHLLSIVVGAVCFKITPAVLSIHTESIEKASAQIGGALVGVVLVTIYKALIEEKFKLWLIRKEKQFKLWFAKRKENVNNILKKKK